ncbi:MULTISPECIES: mechanosensitive ion channel family protein [Citromicrobium]|uniref:mechanosensitive ion channel family protein n=1 Tax=Citromicrobium TaxID=72173 RepID=UPI0001DD0C77|nr:MULTISPECIES: mechanosensitive ion channel family protein [Citromicrobium]ALG59657.1 MscS mechanosensitive ion channel [Citromicrobium sp. JL477]KPM17236.1 MscS mechanosensitive ion channel [Citromicrobium sp. JL1351]KPM20173.1 MscS mechanosensitive ion channel [Citromicrobium sp. JL31]KPM29282.1 MscS mechanosensitive ion channel [Citromicrobium sp. JL2201]
MLLRLLAALWLACLAAPVATPLAAALPGLVPEQAEPQPTPTATGALSDERDPQADSRIATRLRDIYAEVEAFSGVEVAVNQGVVRLTGSAPSQEAIDDAGAIAARFDVVTVENEIARDTSLEGTADIVTALIDRLRAAAGMLPLIGVALLIGLAILLVGYLLASLKFLWRLVTPNDFLADLVASAIRFIAIIFAAVIALDIIGATALLGAVLGGAGVIGIALGFAMRDTVENYVASLMLSLRQPFRANDLVQIDAFEGRVVRLTSRATVLMTLEGNHLRIPNSAVFKAVIVNFTRNPQRRFDFTLGVDADDDATAAAELGRTTLEALPFMLAEPAPEARIVEVGDSAVMIRFLGWIDQRETDWFKAQSVAIPAVKTALEDAGFGLPEPIYRLRFDPRSASLPFENIADRDAGSVGETTPPRKPRAAAPPPSDVTPRNEIDEMVEEERDSSEQKQDLLDHRRPVE